MEMDERSGTVRPSPRPRGSRQNKRISPATTDLDQIMVIKYMKNEKKLLSNL